MAPPPAPPFDLKWVPTALDAAPGPLVDGKYLHWDELRHRTPPPGIKPEQWWFALKIRRRSAYTDVPLLDRDRRQTFSYVLTDPIPEGLHRIDTGAGAWIGTTTRINDDEMHDQYYVRSLIEEAITSSKIEGAITTRRVAKDMIREGRKPRDRSEQMILNNYDTMKRLGELKTEALSSDLMMEIHRLITHDTLKDPGAVGRLRRAGEDIVISDQDGTIYHYPPDARELDERMQIMCDFANRKTPSGFLHPVLRAIILHFWLAYDHPFVDGNGRAARALFYWSMLRSNYWLFEYISISEVILRATSDYYRAFLHTETDDNDLTYFLVYHLGVIQKAVESLHRYVERTHRELDAVDKAIKQLRGFNRRQIALLAHAMRHPGYRYSIEGHRVSHGVVYQTARTDLLGLASRGLLEMFKVGKSWYFQPVPNLDLKLHRVSERRASRRRRSQQR